MSEKIVQKSEEEWRNSLPEDSFCILRQHGTERPGSSPLNSEKRVGVYHCVGCDQPLFDSNTKYESGSGWPSFFQPRPDAVENTIDNSHGMVRTEVHCATCKGHLGHEFPDGPKPTGLRYCINGLALRFIPS